MPSPAPPAPGPASLRERALAVLCIANPAAKAEATHTLWAALAALPDEDARVQALSPAARLAAPAEALPGRPPRPALVPPQAVAQRSPFTPEGLAALLHAVCHIEFNAINLALDAVWRFGGMPAEFYRDWLRVADEEATHFHLLRSHLLGLGHDYGDFPAHDGLWEMCLKTAHDVTARMALVPRTMEARGLDATPLIQARLAKVGSPGEGDRGCRARDGEHPSLGRRATADDDAADDAGDRATLRGAPGADHAVPAGDRRGDSDGRRGARLEDERLRELGRGGGDAAVLRRQVRRPARGDRGDAASDGSGAAACGAAGAAFCAAASASHIAASKGSKAN